MAYELGRIYHYLRYTYLPTYLPFNRAYRRNRELERRRRYGRAPTSSDVIVTAVVVDVDLTVGLPICLSAYLPLPIASLLRCLTPFTRLLTEKVDELRARTS